MNWFYTWLWLKIEFTELTASVQYPNMFGGMNFFPEIPRPFNTQYRCYPVAMMPRGERSDVEAGGKIIMPPSALDQLTRCENLFKSS